MEKIKSYNPSKEIRNFIIDIYNDYQYCRSLREQSYDEFDGLTPTSYWSESRKRVKNFLPPLSSDQSLSNIFFGKTRNKRNTIAGFIGSQRPRVEFDVRGGKFTSKNDKHLSLLLKTVYDYFMDKENSDEKYLDWIIETLDVGVGYLQEGYNFSVRNVRYITKEDFATGKKEIKEEELIENDGCQATIIPIEDVFISDFYQPDIQKQPFVIIREYLPYIIAKQRYGKYKDWNYVSDEYGELDKSNDTFFFKLLQERVDVNYVEVLHYYDKNRDLYIITANGILLTDIDNPIPFDHKKIPIVKNVYEKMGSTFFYGMSMPMKIVSEQDAFSECGNNNMDRSKISSIPTAIANYETEIEQDYIGTYNILKIDGDSGLRELQFQSVKAGDMQFMDFLSKMIAESTVSDSFSGAIEGVTATEIMNSRAQNQQNLGPFLTYVYTAAKQHAELRLANILQYFFMASKKYNNKTFDTREISVRTTLYDGTEGIRIIRVVSSKDKIPSKIERIREKEKRGIVEQKNSKGQVVKRNVEVNYEYHYITVQEVYDIQYTISIVPGSTLPETQSLKKALVLELDNTMASPLFASITDPKKLQKLTVEAFGYSIDDVKLDQDASQALQQQENQQSQSQSMQYQSQSMQPKKSELIQQMAGTSTAGVNELMAG